MHFPVPYFSSMSRSIRGTTTAGETAPRTAPMRAASMRETPRSSGANITYPTISQHAGTKDIITAGRPTFFRSERSSDSPAFIRIMIRAMLLSSDDMPSIDGSSRSSTYGPRTTPLTSMPTMRGSRSLSTIAATESPTRKMKDNDVSIKNLPKCRKADASCMK